MEILLLIIIGIPALSLLGAVLVSRMVYGKLLKAGVKYPKLIRAGVFVCSFAVIFLAIYFLVNQNVRFER